jgi:hypothetical protein
VVTLNQMVLSHNAKLGGAKLAEKLIDIYFTLFRLVLDRKIGVAAERAEGLAARDAAAATAPSHKGRHKVRHKGSRGRGGRGGGRGKKVEEGKKEGCGVLAEEVDSRMLGALITGVRRSFPYVEAGGLTTVFQTHAQQLFRTVHLAPFTVSTQALMLLFQARPLPPGHQTVHHPPVVGPAFRMRHSSNSYVCRLATYSGPILRAWFRPRVQPLSGEAPCVCPITLARWCERTVPQYIVPIVGSVSDRLIVCRSVCAPGYFAVVVAAQHQLCNSSQQKVPCTCAVAALSCALG